MQRLEGQSPWKTAENSLHSTQLILLELSQNLGFFSWANLWQVIHGTLKASEFNLQNLSISQTQNDKKHLEACYGNLPASASVSEKRFFEWEPTKNKQKVKTKTRQSIGFPHFFFSLSFSLIQDHQPDQLFPLMTIFREFPVEKKKEISFAARWMG